MVSYITPTASIRTLQSAAVYLYHTYTKVMRYEQTKFLAVANAVLNKDMMSTYEYGRHRNCGRLRDIPLYLAAVRSAG